MYWLWKKNQTKYTKGNFPAVLTIQVLYPSQKLRTFNLLAIPVCQYMCHSFVLKLKQTISCLFYSKAYYCLSFTTASCISEIPSYPFSSPRSGYLISFTLSLQTFPTAGWSSYSVPCCPLWNYIFLKYHVQKWALFHVKPAWLWTKVNTSPIFQCPVLFLQHQTIFSPFWMHNFISSMELLLGALTQLFHTRGFPT